MSKYTRVYNKRIKNILPLLVILVLIVWTGRQYLTEAVVQMKLENAALLHHKY
ncbi:uncharacterized protein SPAPADRAFT_58327, partial [Spathaspora passalidarum NRRL Y-27907]